MDGEIESTCPRRAAPCHGCTAPSRGIGGCEGPPCVLCPVSTRDAMRRDATRPAVARSPDPSSSFVSFSFCLLKPFLRPTNESLARLAFQMVSS